MTEVVEVDTPQGPARLHIDPARRPRVVLALGHGAGGGVEAADLVAVARLLPDDGVTVVRVEQPWCVAGRRLAVQPPRLDEAWVAACRQLPGGPLVVGGRSAGARVACRTARELGAVGVVALAFPFHPPGREGRGRGAELETGLPTLVVQGDRDAFGGPGQVPVRPGREVLVVPGADHAFRVARSGPLTGAEALDLLSSGVAEFLMRLLPRTGG